MYHEYIIKPLSEPQLKKLAKGGAVKFQKATEGHKVYLTKEQRDKLNGGGKFHMISFSDQQLKHCHGKGFFDSIKKFAKKHKDLINPIIKAVKGSAHKGLNKASAHLHAKIAQIPEIKDEIAAAAPVAGEGIKRRGRPSKKKTCGWSGEPSGGEGIVSDILGGLSGAADTFGFGVEKPKRGRKYKKSGDGLLGNLIKSGAKALAPVIIDAASNAAKNQVQGMGIKKGRSKKDIVGMALYPAGGALKVAGLS